MDPEPPPGSRPTQVSDLIDGWADSKPALHLPVLEEEDNTPSSLPRTGGTAAEVQTAACEAGFEAPLIMLDDTIDGAASDGEPTTARTAVAHEGTHMAQTPGPTISIPPISAVSDLQLSTMRRSSQHAVETSETGAREVHGDGWRPSAASAPEYCLSADSAIQSSMGTITSQLMQVGVGSACTLSSFLKLYHRVTNRIRPCL